MTDNTKQAINTPDFVKLSEQAAKLGEQTRQLMTTFVNQAINTSTSMQTLGSADALDTFTIPDKAVVAKSFLSLTERMLADPVKLAQAQAKYYVDLAALWQATAQQLQAQNNPGTEGNGNISKPLVRPAPGDRRFQDDSWQNEPFYDYIKQFYLLTAQSILNSVHDTDGLDDKTAAKVDFYTRQYLDAMAPTNFIPLNPKVVKATVESGGENLLKGLTHMLDDLNRGKGELRIRMTDTDAFRLGENVATTPGKVIFQTALMQLIQYTPSTDKVYKRPLLIVPPWINKYYILDLKPKNSFIKWAVEQGFTVFVISWVNPDASLAERDFEDYLLEGTLAALEAIEKATGEPDINAIGYCLGGTLLMSTLAYLDAAGEEKRIKSATLFTTLVDFSEAGELSVFVDEEQVTLMEQQMEKAGYLEGSQMAHVFNMLRANDLIWSFWVNNYLLGKEPMAFDLLYWNSDSTRMPKRMHSFYLRNMYLNNKLREPGGIDLVGEPIDLRKIKIPLYFLSTKEDHIAPWQGCYQGALLPSGAVKFVLGGSGHIAGVVNPPAANKYGYWASTGKLPQDAEAWLANAKQHEGSWWPDWLSWVKRRAGKQIPARKPGDGELKPLEDAPGSYVKVRIDAIQ